MLRTLWSGVSGMQAHQISLDIESNNIANVNTNGFKYSRADFSSLVVQQRRGATVPYGGFGGVNDLSVGLGVGIETATKVFSQGSLQNTDRKEDLAISGNGMFVVSGDNGFTKLFSRDGGFAFDAVGNLVNSGGYIVQGWTRDLASLTTDPRAARLNIVDSTGPITGIQIDPRLSIPASPTANIGGRINLTSGSKTNHTALPSPLDSSGANNYVAGGLDRFYDTFDRQVEVPQDLGVMFNAGSAGSSSEAFRLQEGQGTWVSYQTARSRPLRLGAAAANLQTAITTTININGVDITWTNNPASGTSHRLAAQIAINNLKDKTGVEALIQGNDLILQNLNNMDGDASKKNIRARIVAPGIFGSQPPANGNGAGGFVTGANGAVSQTETVTTAFLYRYTKQTDADSASGAFRTTEDLRALMQQDANKIKRFGGDSAAAATAINNGTWMESNFSVSVKLNNTGQFEINNKHDGVSAANSNDASFDNLNLFVSGFNDELTTTNVLFRNTMKGLNTGVLVEGGNVSTSGGLTLATYGVTIEVFDSLGTKHGVKFEFLKTSDREWSFRVIAPEPAEFIGGTAQRPNILEGGSVTFGENGAVTGFNPSTIQFVPNNGSSSPQNINLEFGTSGGFDGFTSHATESQNNSFKGDGYTAGVLKDFKFNKDGVMIGTFDNGQNLALAQVALATFSNYGGLQELGGNLYSESPNSGSAVIGVANTGGRGQIEASKLEMSNTDLSRGLTQLIIMQRGFQANSKSVTTADQILNTLIGLKQ